MKEGRKGGQKGRGFMGTEGKSVKEKRSHAMSG